MHHGPGIMELSQKRLQDIHATLLFLCLWGTWNSSAAPAPSGAQGALWGHLRHHLPRHILKSVFPRVLPFSRVLSWAWDTCLLLSDSIDISEGCCVPRFFFVESQISILTFLISSPILSPSICHHLVWRFTFCSGDFLFIMQSSKLMCFLFQFSKGCRLLKIKSRKILLFLCYLFSYPFLEVTTTERLGYWFYLPDSRDRRGAVRKAKESNWY